MRRDVRPVEKGQPAHLAIETTAKGDVRHTAAVIAKAQRDLNYEPRTGLEEGLANELAWLKEIYDF